MIVRYNDARPRKETMAQAFERTKRAAIRAIDNIAKSGGVHMSERPKLVRLQQEIADLRPDK